MNDNMGLTIEVTDIEPEAVYKDTVYTQTIVARLQDGTKINLFDSVSSIMGKDTVGDILDISISILYNEVKNISGKAIGIYPTENPSSKWSYDLVCIIENVDKDDSSILLDFGSGIVSIGLNNNLEELIKSTDTGPDDCLYIPDARIDLIKINHIHDE